jgi:hypothetical protein
LRRQKETAATAATTAGATRSDRINRRESECGSGRAICVIDVADD